MKIAVMQPYVFPYLGYFQLLAKADRFVFFDDVAFIKKGWIHRNRLLVNGREHLFTVPIENASQNRLILDTQVNESEDWRSRLLKTIEMAYKKAPGFDFAFPIVREVFRERGGSIADLARRSVTAVLDALEVSVPIRLTSAEYGNRDLPAEARIIDICRRENATGYLNPIGGTDLYSAENFRRAGIKLEFVKPFLPEYRQSCAEFVPGLSIIDVMMWTDKEAVRGLLPLGITMEGAP